MDYRAVSAGICLFITFLLFFPSSAIYADDGYKETERHHKRFEKNGKDHSHHRKEKHEHNHDDYSDHSTRTPKNSVYRKECGACHLVYQPNLLPEASWKTIMNNLKNHFGESVELNDDSIRTIGNYLRENCAERSRTEMGTKIVKSLKNKKPTRITEIPYILHEHHDISSKIFSRNSIGSFSNCNACHTNAEDGVFDDDNVRIPQ